MTKRSRPRRARPAPVLLAALVLGLLGCNTFQGARLYGAGTRALEAGESARAVRALEGAAERVPHASEVHNHLGLAYLATGRRDDARRAFARAVALDCDNRAARRNLRQLDAPPSQR